MTTSENKTVTVSSFRAVEQDLNSEFNSWMTLLKERSLNEKDENNLELLLKGLQDHPEWVNQTDRDQKTPLMRASCQGDTEVIRALLRAGANPNVKDLCDWTPLIWASYRCALEEVKALIRCGADLNAQDQEGWTALMWASYRGQLEMVQDLIHQGSDPGVLNKCQKTASDLAKINGHDDVVILLEAYCSRQALSPVIQPEDPQPLSYGLRSGLNKRTSKIQRL